MIRVRIINRWFAEKELTKTNIEQFFLEYKEKGRKNKAFFPSGHRKEGPSPSAGFALRF